jgi:hypothetical protein
MSGTTLTQGRLTVSQIETILGKAVKDPAFAAKLQQDPAGTLKGLGYTPHADEVDFFKFLAQNFGSAATTLHGKDPQHYSAEA